MSRRKGIQLAYPFSEKRLAKWEPPYLVQPKLDGERCRAIFSRQAYPAHHRVTLLSSEENLIASVPHISLALERLNLPDGTELDGELYVHGMTFEDIFSIVSRTKNIHPDYETMQYHIFDRIEEKSQMERSVGLIPLLLPLAGRDSPLKAVSTIPADNFDEVMGAYDRFIEEDYEGMIVRHKDAPYIRRRSIYMLKFKPKKSDIYRIVGWKEEVSIEGVPKGRMGALICESEDTMNQFSVGSGMTDGTRVDLWRMKDSLDDPTEPGLIGRYCRVDYQHITSGKGVPRFPIFITVLGDDELL